MESILEALDAYLSTELSDSDMMDLEFALLKRIDEAGAQQAFERVGYSKRLMRFHLQHNGGGTPETEWKILLGFQENYSMYTNRLAIMANRQRDLMQQECVHVWEYDDCSRDHRSHYVCRKCGAFR